MAFIEDPDHIKPPIMGLVFSGDIEAGKTIFSDWLKRLGRRDAYGELRISIIEGDIPGLEPGYSVHITSDPANTMVRAQVEGKKIEFPP